MEGKRETAVLIPYRVFEDQIFVFLQKRAKESKVLPDCFAFFGGKLELSETPEEALKREIKEELDVDLTEYYPLGQYFPAINEEVVLNVYFAKVGGNFENEVKINEGEYGRFFSEDDVERETMIIDSDKKIIRDLYQSVKKYE